MASLPPLKVKDYLRIDDELHEALGELEDFCLGPWWFRCVEFHFGRGIYPAGDQFGWHLHKELQIEIPLRGEFVFSPKGDNHFCVKPGSVCIIPPGTVHRWKAKSQGVMIGFLLAIVPRASSLDASLQSELQMNTFTPPALEVILEGLLSEFVYPSPEDEFSAKRKVNWIYLVITRILGAMPLGATPLQDEALDSEPSFRRQRVVAKIMRFIDANIEGDLTMERIKEVAGLSTRQIHRLFIEVIGGSCHSYIMERRLEVARSKLQGNPTLSIKEVAYASGFASSAHFSTKFKRNFGVPPTEYRA